MRPAPQSMPVYVAHWYGTGSNGATSYSRQAQQTTAFLAATSNGQPQSRSATLNVWEGTSGKVCNQSPTNTALPYLRSAGYRDAWLTIHGGARRLHRHDEPRRLRLSRRATRGSGSTTRGRRRRYQPTDMQRFGMVAGRRRLSVGSLRHRRDAAIPVRRPRPAPPPHRRRHPAAGARTGAGSAGHGTIVLYVEERGIAGMPAVVRRCPPPAGCGRMLRRRRDRLPHRSPACQIRVCRSAVTAGHRLDRRARQPTRVREHELTRWLRLQSSGIGGTSATVVSIVKKEGGA